MKRKVVELKHGTAIILPIKDGHRIRVHRDDEGCTVINMENLTTVDDCVKSGHIHIIGRKNLEALEECLRHSMDIIQELSHHGTPTNQRSYEKHLEICNITLKP